MGVITHSVEINAPLQEVYHQWTRFEEFPRFMEGVDEVRQDGPNRLFWKAKIGGKEKHWEAEITEQVPNTSIGWRSVDGALNRGAVTFEQLNALQTRITLTMEYEPEGFIERAGDALGIPLGQVAEDLNRFREFMESGRESLSRDREVPPAAIVTEAIASGMGRTGGGPMAGEADEPHQKHGTVIADTPRPMAIEGSSIAENTETDRSHVRSLAPTHEQIARRAYELYLERGERPGDAREDWLTAESELFEKAYDNRTAQ